MSNEQRCTACHPYRKCEACFRAEEREHDRDLRNEEDEAGYAAEVVEPTVEWLNRGWS